MHFKQRKPGEPLKCKNQIVWYFWEKLLNILKFALQLKYAKAFAFIDSVIDLDISSCFFFSNVLVLRKNSISNLHVQISFNLLILNDNRFLFLIINVVWKHNTDLTYHCKDLKILIFLHRHKYSVAIIISLCRYKNRVRQKVHAFPHWLLLMSPKFPDLQYSLRM